MVVVVVANLLVPCTTLRINPWDPLLLTHDDRIHLLHLVVMVMVAVVVEVVVVVVTVGEEEEVMEIVTMKMMMIIIMKRRRIMKVDVTQQ